MHGSKWAMRMMMTKWYVCYQFTPSLDTDRGLLTDIFNTIVYVQHYISRYNTIIYAINNHSHRIPSCCLTRTVHEYRCCNIGYPSETHLKLKYRETSSVHDLCSIAQLVWNFIQSTAVVLPCYVHSFKTIGQLKICYRRMIFRVEYPLHILTIV